MKRRECASLIILALAAVPALLVAIGQVYVTGVDGIRLRRTETIDLLTEIVVLFFLYLFTIWKIESSRIRTTQFSMPSLRQRNTVMCNIRNISA